MASTPKAPDPYATAQAQGSANFVNAQQNAIMGNVNEYTPYGSKTYQQIGWDPVYDSSGRVTWAPRYQSTVNLSKDQQKLLGLQTQTQYNLGNLGVSQSSRLQNLLSKNLGTEGLPAWQTYQKAPQLATSFGGNNPMAMKLGDAGDIRQDKAPTDRAAVEQAMMGRYNQDAARQNKAQDAQLAARGLTPGSAQYGTVQQSRDRARTDAVNQAYLASGEESRAAQNAYNQAQQQRYGQGLSTAQFQNAAQEQAFQQALARGSYANQYAQQNWGNANTWADMTNALRGQQLQERSFLRNAPINEISALLSGSQVTTPQFQPYASPNVQGVNIGQMIYDNYNSRAQQAAATNQGLFGLGGAGLSMLTMPFGGSAGSSLLGRLFGMA